jgi:hypothetical protein
MDFNTDSMICLPLYRVFAVAKTADAHELYFDQVKLVCEKAGLELTWGPGESCQMGVLDLHQGQALGLLRHLIK